MFVSAISNGISCNKNTLKNSTLNLPFFGTKAEYNISVTQIESRNSQNTLSNEECGSILCGV